MLAAANNKGKCFVWKLLDEDTSKLEPLQKLEAHSKYILKCLFSPDSQYVHRRLACFVGKKGNGGGVGEIEVKKGILHLYILFLSSTHWVFVFCFLFFVFFVFLFFVFCFLFFVMLLLFGLFCG
jgi:hypothetical protein